MKQSELEQVHKVYVNGNVQKMSYQNICKELGFVPEIGFVDITTTGAITFTLGKPEEIKALYRTCQAKGFKASKNLNVHCRRMRLI